MAAFLLVALSGAVLRSAVVEDAAPEGATHRGIYDRENLRSGLVQTSTQGEADALPKRVSKKKRVSKFFKKGFKGKRMKKLAKYFKKKKPAPGSACEKLPGQLLAEDSESPLGLPGDTVPYRNQLLFEFSTDKVPLEPEEEAAWEILEKEVFAQGGIGTFASFVFFDKEFTSQTGGASSVVKAARNKKAFVGLWSYLTLAMGSKELAAYVRKTAAELRQEPDENLGIDEARENKDTSNKLWLAALLTYIHSNVFDLDELALISDTDGQAKVLRTLAWPVVRRWLEEKNLVTTKGDGNGDYWKCFAELVGGKKSWVVHEVDKLYNELYVEPDQHYRHFLKMIAGGEDENDGYWM